MPYYVIKHVCKNTTYGCFTGIALVVNVLNSIDRFKYTLYRAYKMQEQCLWHVDSLLHY